jgi:hypothetical protein
MARKKADAAAPAPEKKDPIYTVARLEPLTGKLVVVAREVPAKTQEKAMDAVDADGGGFEPGDKTTQYQLIAWLAGSTRSKRYTRKVVTVSDSEQVAISDDLFRPAESHPAE